jgi:hypothetical protein
MARFITLLIGFLMIFFFYYVVGWFILNQPNAFIWPWWVKVLYLLISFASWGNFSEHLNDE